MKNPKRILQVNLVFILISLIAGCRASKSPDYWPTAGWRTTTPEEQGMDSEILARMIEFIMQQNFDIHSVTVIRNGYMVADVIFYPYESDTLHQLHSASKSITSALIGITINQGYIDGVEQPVLSFFPERSVANHDANKEKMTLEHLLTMESGFDYPDSLKYGFDYLKYDFGDLDRGQAGQTDDWVQYVLDLPMREAPGTRFQYAEVPPFLLSAIIQETTGKNAYSFARENLFRPLGISIDFWPSSPQGITIGSEGLLMKPHDMAKIGYLYLNEGRWDDTQIISADYIAASSQEHGSGPPHGAYGYQWWIGNNGEYFFAAGYFGQSIIVIPRHEMVVVITSNLEDKGPSFFNNVRVSLLDYIIASVQSSTPLPANPESVELLNSNIQQASQYRAEPKTVPPLSEIAKRVSGQTYIMDSNQFAIESVTLTFPGEAEAVLSVVRRPGGWSEWQVGLDNIYRFLHGEYGITEGIKGEWVSDETFVIDIDHIGNAWRTRFRLTFIGEKITFEYSSMFGKTSINGRLEE